MKSRKSRLKKLYPSFADPMTWRTMRDSKKLPQEEWKKLRMTILQRDNFTCRYCGFKTEKWQIAQHIDGNHENNSPRNLETICQMCNLIHHAGQGCVVQGVVDLYAESKYTQNEVVILTRKMRAAGKTDKEIIRALGLKRRMPFEMDWKYLKPLIGFVTSRSAPDNSMAKAGLAHMYRVESQSLGKA